MIINIDDDLFYKVISIIKNRSVSLHAKLLKIKPLNVVPSDTLTNAKAVKTQRVRNLSKKL